jgi:hypothetical protein
MMNTEENNYKNSLLSGQDPHQKEELDQATNASAGSFTLEPEKGISPDPDEYNKGDKRGNIKETADQDFSDDPAPIFDAVSEVDPDADDNTVTREDLRALDGEDGGGQV